MAQGVFLALALFWAGHVALGLFVSAEAYNPLRLIGVVEIAWRLVTYVATATAILGPRDRFGPFLRTTLQRALSIAVFFGLLLGAAAAALAAALLAIAAQQNDAPPADVAWVASLLIALLALAFGAGAGSVLMRHWMGAAVGLGFAVLLFVFGAGGLLENGAEIGPILRDWRAGLEAAGTEASIE